MTQYEDVRRMRLELARLRMRRAGNVAMGIVLAVCVVYIASQVGIAAARGRLTNVPRNRTEAYR
jgi:hypothetical protein